MPLFIIMMIMLSSGFNIYLYLFFVHFSFKYTF